MNKTLHPFKIGQIGVALAFSFFSLSLHAAPYTNSVYRAGANSYVNVFDYHGIANNTQTQTRLQDQYNQFFFSADTTNQSVMRNTGNMSYIVDIASDDIRSEGMSYGMMIAVQMNDQTTFDRLWRFAKTYMENADGTFAWQLNTTTFEPKYGTYSENPAPDAEEYFATALIFAGNRGWTSSEFNYHNDAQDVLDTLRTELFRTQTEGYAQILFSPAPAARYQFTDPSYHLPAFYEIWKRFDTANANFWGNAHYQSRFYQFYGAHPVTGLFPEYSTFYPGLTEFFRDNVNEGIDDTENCDGGTDDRTVRIPDNVYGAMSAYLAGAADVCQPYRDRAPTFASDAYRVIGNIGMDFAWFSACCQNESTGTGLGYWGALERNIVERQYNFFNSRNDVDGGYASGYPMYLTAAQESNTSLISPTVTYRSAGHVAMNAVGALAAGNDSLARPYVQALWNQNVPTGDYRYYDGMLHMLAMLHVSGNFRMYFPLASGFVINQTPTAGNQTQVSFSIRNTTATAQSNPSAYYYFTTENGRTPVVDDVYTPNISSLSLQNNGGNNWAVKMQYTDVTLQPGQTGSQADIFRIRYSDWSSFDSSNDYSAPEGSETLVADRIAVFNSAGKLIMGSKPEGAATPPSGNYTIKVRARGTSGNETIKLTVGGTTIATWNLASAFKEYSVTTSLGGGINVEYINDAPNRDVVVDYAVIGGITHQAEAQSGNSAAWGNGQCGGGQYTEWMHCNGYLGFSAYK